MSVRSFHSVFMASAVAGAALGCYLVSLRVASERSALEDVESSIVQTQADIRLLETEIGTRGRLAQLERWNVRVLSLSAPNADQILGDKFQLARLIRPEPKLDVDAPVVLASAPAPQPPQPLAQDDEAGVAGTTPVASELLHEASLKVPAHDAAPAKAKAAKAETVASKAPAKYKKVGDKKAVAATRSVTKPVRTAKADPLAPLPEHRSTAKDTGHRQ
ncbi:MAG TPA: hypothetical protein VFI88_04175 [Sphingomicrobium sp.]|jgi:hypothetical protein|nr:hypothetical protein [Sphingomicrobium sp.]